MQYHVVVVGGGFGGLQVVRHLRRAPVSITLVDRQNYSLFQPLAYQVATGGLSPAEIASPLRAIVKRQANASVVLAEVNEVRPRRPQDLPRRPPERRRATRARVRHARGRHRRPYSYFGHPEWQAHAPELKSLDGALEIRTRILTAFEAAEVEEGRRAASELAHVRRRRWRPDGGRDGRADRRARARDPAARFPRVDPRTARVLLSRPPSACSTASPSRSRAKPPATLRSSA